MKQYIFVPLLLFVSFAMVSSVQWQDSLRHEVRVGWSDVFYAAYDSEKITFEMIDTAL